MQFKSYHPMIQFLYFTGVIWFSIWFKHPVFLVISFCTSFLNSVALGKVRAFVFNCILLIGIGLFALYYSYYHHFGITNLRENCVGNRITLEALVYGMVLGVVTSCVLMWFSCIHKIMTTDKIVYLFGRVCPRLSLYLAILLRLVPRIKEKGAQVNIAQKCIGRGLNQGAIWIRIRHFFRMISIIITWTLDNFMESAESMKCRGYSLKGRTAYSIYRFDNRDRSLVIWMFLLITIILMGAAFEQNTILYNPAILMNQITPLSYIFYCAYLLFCMIPLEVRIVSLF